MLETTLVATSVMACFYACFCLGMWYQERKWGRMWRQRYKRMQEIADESITAHHRTIEAFKEVLLKSR